MLETDFMAHPFFIEDFAVAVIAVRLQLSDRLNLLLRLIQRVDWPRLGEELRLLQQKHMHRQVILYIPLGGWVTHPVTHSNTGGGGRCFYDLFNPYVVFALEYATTVATVILESYGMCMVPVPPGGTYLLWARRAAITCKNKLCLVFTLGIYFKGPILCRLSFTNVF